MHRMHRPPTQQRADREGFSGHQLPGLAGDLLVFARGLAADATLADDEEALRGPAVRIGDALTAGVEPRLEPGQQELQRVRFDLIERGVHIQEFPGCVERVGHWLPGGHRIVPVAQQESSHGS